MLPLGIRSEPLIRKFEGDRYESRVPIKEMAAAANEVRDRMSIEKEEGRKKKNNRAATLTLALSFRRR